jgi:sulfite reductase (NADPH) flavoprotein alpha-component
MPSSPIPRTAPFAEEEIEILNRVVGSASVTQRVWLAGFLSGLDAVAASQPVSASRAAEPLTILFASESGNCERLAADMAKTARKQGFKPTVIDMADVDVASLATVRRLAVIAATWGEGDPPARAVSAYADLMSEKAPRLDNLEFGVLALGDTAYAEFCAIGKALDERLAALGGKRVVDRIDCDLDFAQPASRWIDQALKVFAPPTREPRGTVIEVDFTQHAAPAPLEMAEAEVIEHINLNSSRSEKETIHLELAFDGKAPAYQPGDSLDLFAKNDPAYIDALQQAAGHPFNDGLRIDLTDNRDVTTLSLRTIEAYAAATGHQQIKSLLASGEARGWIVGRQLIDLIETFQTPLSAEQLRENRAPACAARLFHCLFAPRSRRRGAPACFGRALPKPRTRAQRCCLQLCRRVPEEGQPGAREAQAEQAFCAARAGSRHHHGRTRHGGGAVPRFPAGAACHRS